MTEIVENTLHEELKGRLSKNDSLNESSNSKDYKYNLFIKCHEKTITIENYNGHHDNILKRKDGNYFMCSIWTRTYKTEDPDAKLANVFVNLSTGEKYECHSLGLFRGSWTFSKDNNYILLKGGISASSATLIILVDLRDLNNINVIYREEIWEPYIAYSCEFNQLAEKGEGNEDLVIKYEYEFYEYKDKTYFDIDNIYKILNPENPYYVDDKEMWKAGVIIHPVKVTVTYRPDENKITPPSDDKWEEKQFLEPDFDDRVKVYMDQGMEWHHAHNKVVCEPPSADHITHMRKYSTLYGTTCTVNEMSEVNVVKSDNFDRFITNVQNPFNFTCF